MDLLRMVVMAVAGCVAAAGHATNSVHLVTGAMLMASGFQAGVRMSLGAIGCKRAWRWGSSLRRRVRAVVAKRRTPGCESDRAAQDEGG